MIGKWRKERRKKSGRLKKKERRAIYVRTMKTVGESTTTAFEASWRGSRTHRSRYAKGICGWVCLTFGDFGGVETKISYEKRNESGRALYDVLFNQQRCLWTLPVR